MCSAYFTGPSSQIPDTDSATARAPCRSSVAGRAPAQPRRRYRGGAAPAGGATGRDGGSSMGRARRATRIAPTAAYGGGGLAAGIGVLGLAGYGLLKVEARMARRIVGQHFDGAPDDDADVRRRPRRADPAGRARRLHRGRHGRRQRQADGRRDRRERGLRAQRPAGAADQRLGHRGGVVRARRAGRQTPWPRCASPTSALIMVGANDVTHRIDTSAGRAAPGADGPRRCARPAPRSSSAPAPTSARSSRWPSRCASWPGGGAGTWRRPRRSPSSRRAGGPCRSATCSARSSRAARTRCSASDRFHPSPAGYARAAAGAAAQRRAPRSALERARPRARRTAAAARASGRSPTPPSRPWRDPGTEVSATAVGGQPRGPRGRWATPAAPAAQAGHRPPRAGRRARRRRSGRSRGPGRRRTGSHRPGRPDDVGPRAGTRRSPHHRERRTAIASTVAARPKRLLSR